MNSEFVVTAGAALEPYPGLAPYRDLPADRALFFGREAEKEKLLDLVLSHDLTVIFARSGLGKTSLINAGLLQPLRDQQFFPVVARLTHDAMGDPVRSVLMDIGQAAHEGGVSVESTGEASDRDLWRYFHSRQFKRGGQFQKPVLILDQFEELFTRITDRQAFIETFADLARRRVPEAVVAEQQAQLSRVAKNSPERERIVALLYGDSGPRVKVVLSLREDYLADLATLDTYIPLILRTTFRLEPLSLEQAREAIESPGAGTRALGGDGFAFDTGVVDEMLGFLRTKRVAGRAVPGTSIDPAPLQILCRYLYGTRKRKRASVITRADLGGERGMERIIARYYRDILSRFKWVRLGWSGRRVRPSLQNLLFVSRPRAAIRKLCRRGLVTRKGQRNSLMGDEIRSEYGLRESELEALVEARLLRADARLDSKFYELSHDTLIGPIVADRRRAMQRRVGAAVVFLNLVVLFPAVYHQITQYLTNRQTSLYRERILRPIMEAHSAEERTKAVNDLAEQGWLDFSGLNLAGIRVNLDLIRNRARYSRFQPLDLSSADLRRADLRGEASGDTITIGWPTRLLGWPTRFVGANLDGATLRRANLTGSNFARASLRLSDCSGALLSTSSFDYANLEGANFAGAFLENADFEWATLDERTNFQDTAWWTAGGWAERDWERLKSQSSPELLTRSPGYALPLRVAANGGDPSDSNDRAWYRATHGVDLELALSEVNSDLKSKPDNASALDTRGYIELRLGNCRDAEHDLELSVRNENAGDRLYHLGLAYECLGDQSSAVRTFAAAARVGYKPTFERLLTPRRRGVVAGQPAAPLPSQQNRQSPAPQDHPPAAAP
jgi:uncharacterized protein YjbI with pentapeptide repeats